METLNRPTALVIGAVALLIGAVGPWITVLGFISAGPTAFTEVWTVMFGGIALIIVSAFTGRYMRPVSIIVGLAALAEVAYVWFHLATEGSSDSDIIKIVVSPSWGLYLTTLTALYLIGSTFIAKKDIVLVPATS
jgi:hypothetical protein